MSSRTMTVLSEEPETSLVLSLEKATLLTELVWSVSVAVIMIGILRKDSFLPALCGVRVCGGVVYEGEIIVWRGVWLSGMVQHGMVRCDANGLVQLGVCSGVVCEL